MPGAFHAILAVGKFFADLAFLAGAGLAVTNIVGLLATVGTLKVLSLATRVLSGRPKAFGQGPPAARDVTVQGSAEPGVIVMGQTRVSGVVIFVGSSGTRNQFLHWLIAVAHHQCEGIDAFWLDQDQILASALDGNGDVTSGKYAGKVRFVTYLGSDAQTASAELDSAFDEWTTNHRGRGITLVHIREELDETVFPDGQHTKNFYFRIKGVRSYDSRLDSTNGGSGTHRYGDPRTWTWSDNATRNQAFYVTGGSKVFDVNDAALKGHLGFGADPVDINWPAFVTAANECDEDVTIPPASPTTTQKRYTLNGVLSTANTLADNMEQLLTASIGQCVFVSGEYVLYAGAYQVPSLTIDEDDLAGNVEVVKDTPRAQRYNAVRGTFFSKDTWQEAEFVPKTSAAYETRDGGKRLWRDITLPFTDDGYRAQRLAQVHLNQSDNQRAVKWEGQVSCFKVGTWEVVQVTCAELLLSSAPHRCIGWEFEETSPVALELRKESSASWADPAVADYGSIAVATPVSIQGDGLPAPTNLRATGRRNGILFEWEAPVPSIPGITYELFEHTAATPFTSATKINPRTAQTSLLLAKTDVTQRYYWVRAKLNTVVSAEAPTGNGLPAKASVVDAALAVSLSPTSLNTIGNVATLTSASCTATPSGGTGPYTYAWSRQTGPVDITANSATAQTTTFNCANLVDAEVNEGIWRCTVTDSLSATAVAEVTVRFERKNLTVTTGNVVQASASGFASTGAVGPTGTPGTQVQNGSGTYTYLWEQTGTVAINGPFAVSSSTAQNPTWSDTNVPDGGTSENWRVTVTDSVSGATAQKTITVTLSWTNLT